ncbi:MAG: tetratricopeptide repeat protein [bacterium]
MNIKKYVVLFSIAIIVAGGSVVYYKSNLSSNSLVDLEKLAVKSDIAKTNPLSSVDSVSSQKYLEMSRSDSVKKDYVSALKNIKKAIELNPNNSIAYADLSGIYYEIGKFDESLSARQLLIESIPKDQGIDRETKPLMISVAYMGQAFVYNDLKQNDKAVLAIQSASEGVDPAANFVVKSFFQSKKSTESFKNLADYQPYKNIVNSILSKTISEPEEHLTFTQSVLYGNNGLAYIFLPKTAHASWFKSLWKAVTNVVSKIVQTVADVFSCGVLDSVGVGGFMAKGCNGGGTSGGTGGTGVVTPPIAGVCGTGSAGACSSGSSNGVSLSGVHNSWTCAGSNGGATSGTCDYRVPVTVSCLNPDPVGINKPVTYTASPSGVLTPTYTWSGVLGTPANGGVNFTTAGYDTYGGHSGPSVTVTDSDGVSGSNSCTAQIGCRTSRKTSYCYNGIVTRFSCVGTDWKPSETTSPDCNKDGTNNTDKIGWIDGRGNNGFDTTVLLPKINVKSFKVIPNTVDEGKKCPIQLQVENVTKCYVRNKYGQVSVQPDALAVVGNKINSSSTESVSVGTHRLFCLGLGIDELSKDAVDKFVVVGTSTCYSNAVSTEK